MIVVGWDVGGVNTKVARVENGELRVVRGRPFELQRAPASLVALLRELATEAGAPDGSAAMHAVTMTAELSQMFHTKREGVAFVLDAMREAFPSAAIRIFTIDGGFVDEADARAHPLAVAAANWAATAALVARHHRNALLVDIGTTTTDLIPIVDGAVVADGRTDPDRLATGELVYTGALRTPAEAIASHILVGGRTIGVSAEGFAIAGDVHLWRGDLAPADYTVAAPDGRPATREYAGQRLARVVCADREMLDERGISEIADGLAAAQRERIAAAIRGIRQRHPSLTTAVVTGLGACIGDRAARAAGLATERLSSALGDDGARCAPAACVAILLARSHQPSVCSVRLQADVCEVRLKPDTTHDTELKSAPVSSLTSERAGVEAVVKIGGGVLARVDDFDRVLTSIADAAREHRILIVPGGGPFADAVREVDDRLRLSDESAHWMAILAMDQYAHVIAERLPGATLVRTPHDIHAAIEAGGLPVLAPSHWLQEADPLPHSWEVTSDSIAAWIAGAVGAGRLILIKPAAATGDLVDPHFARALPAGVIPACVSADQVDVLSAAVHDVHE